MCSDEEGSKLLAYEYNDKKGSEILKEENMEKKTKRDDSFHRSLKKISHKIFSDLWIKSRALYYRKRFKKEEAFHSE